MVPFLSPLMLGWLAAAALPIAIHLLSRQQAPEVRWAAMRFLEAARRRTARRVRFEQFLLLSLRTLIVVLLVLAVANPVSLGDSLLGGPLASGLPGAERRLHIVVIDDSLSTRTSVAAESSFDRIRRAIEQLATARPPGPSDGWVLLTMSADEPAESSFGQSAEPPILRDPQQLRAELDRLRSSERSADPVGTLRRVDRLIRATAAEFDARRLTVLTDNARTAWMPAVGPAEPEPSPAVIAAARAVLAADPTLSWTVLDLGPREPVANLAVTAIQHDGLAEPDPVVNPGGVSVAVTVANLGELSADGVRVRLRVLPDGSATPAVSEPLSLRPGRAATANFAVRFRGSPLVASHGLTAELVTDAEGGAPWSDGLAEDNRRHLAVRVPRKLPVLLIDGEPGAGPLDGETVFLRLALSAGPEEDETAAVFAATVIPDTAAALRSVDLSRFALVALVGVAEPDAAFAQRLSEWCRAGGAVLSWVGRRSVPGAWNQRLNADSSRSGDGLLPGGARLLGDAVAPAETAPFRFRLPSSAAPHSVLGFLPGSPAEVSLRGCGCQRFQRLELPAERADVERVLDFDDGRPAVLLGRFGAGRTGLVTTSADADWANWGARPAVFVPLVRRMALWLVGPSLQQPLQLAVGDRLDFVPAFGQRLPKPILSRVADAASPASAAESLELRAAADGSAVRSEQPFESAGLYRLAARDEARPKTLLAVNVSSAEGRPQRLSQAELARALGLGEAADESVRLLAEPNEIAAFLIGGGPGESWGRGLLAAAMAALLVETLLAAWLDRRRRLAAEE